MSITRFGHEVGFSLQYGDVGEHVAVRTAVDAENIKVLTRGARHDHVFYEDDL